MGLWPVGGWVSLVLGNLAHSAYCPPRKGAPPPPPTYASTRTQALPCPSMGACLTIVFLTAPLGFLLWALPCLSTGLPLAVIFRTFSMLAQGGGG